RAGFETLVLEADADRLASGRARVEAFVADSVQRGKLDQQAADAALSRLRGTTDVDELADAGFVVEAITEDEGAKVALFGRIDAVVSFDAVIATNTSALSVTRLATTVSNPERFGGLHFFSPAQL